MFKTMRKKRARRKGMLSVITPLNSFRKITILEYPIDILEFLYTNYISNDTLETPKKYLFKIIIKCIINSICFVNIINSIH